MRPALPARDARAHASEVAKRILSEAPRALRRRSGGLTNVVYQADLRGRSLIVRMNADAGKAAAFQREAAAIQLARRHGVPAPEVLHVGAAPLPHMVLARVPGKAAHTSAAAPLALVRELGALTARIHRIRVVAFGPDGVQPPSAAPRPSWADHLHLHLNANARIAELERLHVITASAADAMRRTLEHMTTWRRNAVLHHGDIRLKNVMINRDAQIVCLLDWENSVGSVPTLWDLSIALHDLNVDQKEAFLQGYGLKPQQLARLAPFLRLLNALNYAPVVAAIARRGEGRKLGWQRARLAGHLDLY